MGARGTAVQQLLAALRPGNQELRAILEALDEDIDTLYTEDDVTAGTVAASKVVKVDANKDISAFRVLGAKDIDAGSSGVAGTVDVFPSTASKGKLAFAAADSAGDTTTTVINASQAGVRTYTIPDHGESASFMLKSVGSGAETAGAITLSKTVGKITTAALTTAQNAEYTITVTNTLCAAADHVFCSVANGTNTQGTPIVKTVTPAAGSFVIVLKNIHHAAEALNGTLVVSFQIVKA